MFFFQKVRKSEEKNVEKYSFGAELGLGGSGGVKYDRTGSGKAMEIVG